MSQVSHLQVLKTRYRIIMMKQAKIIFDRDFTIGKIDSRLWGSFVEHLGLCMYGGLHDPTQKCSDRNGFRNDVKQLICELGVTNIRYPGGNFVSGYHWKDGIGPKDSRPRKKDLAWNAVETNEVGTDEFASLMKELGVELIMSVNLGTGLPEEAGDLVDYCNTSQGTYWSDLRKTHGQVEPYGIKTWCLGNEMDGDWQIHSLTAHEYGRKAKETAKIMKWMDNEIKLIACGSCTNEVGHKTYGDWDLCVLEETYEYIDYLSLHRYYNYHKDKQLVYESHDDVTDIPSFFQDLQEYISTITNAINFIKGKKRSSHSVYIAFDEWGVITSSSALPGGAKQDYGYATFTLLDAVIYGGLLCTFLNNCDTVKIANQSLLINEGGMISVTADGGAMFQVTANPFRDTALYAKGTSLQAIQDLPTASTNHHGNCPYIISSATYDEKTGLLYVFVANVSLFEDVELLLELRSFRNLRIESIQTLYHEDPYVYNDVDFELTPEITYLQRSYNDPCNIIIKRHSWNVIRCKECD